MEEDVEFFGGDGHAVCYSPDGEHLYLWSGEPVAYVTDEKVYSFNGRLLGWFTNGWLYDRANRPALFSSDSSGGPARPARRARPAKHARRARPAKHARQAPHARPARRVSWSDVPGSAYFSQ